MTYDEYIKKYQNAKEEGKAEDQEGKPQSSYDAYMEKYGKQYESSFSSKGSSLLNDFSSAYRTFVETAGSDFQSLGWDNAQELQANASELATDLRNRMSSLKTYLYANRGDMAAYDYDEAFSFINSVSSSIDETMGWYNSSLRYYSQFETEQDYKDHVASQKEYEDMVNLDLEASQKEIDDLTAKRDAFSQNNEFDWTDAGQRQAHQQQMDAYEAEIAQKTQHLNQAKHIQEGIKLSSASGNADFNRYNGYVSTESDNWWKKMVSQYSMGYDDLTYEYINGKENGMRSEIIQNAIAYNADNSLDETDKWKIYDHMTADEVGVYNYYYAKEGKEAANKYLDSIQETLNHREATSMYENMEDKTALELLFGVNAGLDQFESGIKNLFNTEDGYIAPSAFQIASGMVREDLADAGPKLPAWMGGVSLGQMGYDAITTTANMAPSVLTSLAVSMVNPVAGEIVGTSLMGASAAGNAYQEALNLGYSKGQARAYSALVGGSEAGLQYLLGGIGKLGGKLTGNAVTKLVSGIDNAFARAAIKLGGSMLSEGMEEGLQEVLTPWFKNLVFHTDESVNWSEVAYSTLLGALTAGFMEGGGVVSGEVNTYKTGRKLQAADVSAQRLAEIGKTMSADTVAYQLAGRVNENTGAYTMGRLFNEIGAEITEMNKADIQRSLEQNGFPKDVAAKNAEAFARVVAGEKLTDGQISVIEANAELAKTVREVIIDPNSTVNQRTQGYKEVLKALAQEKTAPKASRMNPAEAGQENTAVPDMADTQGENAAASPSEADTAQAKVRSIASIADGKMTVRLEDGTEVNATDADLDPEEAVIIKTIADIKGISAADANFILGSLKAASGVNPQWSALGASEAYRYGFYGMSEDHMMKHGAFASSLTETQRRAIYETGRNARQTQVEAKQEAVSKKESVGDKNTPTGKVHFDGDRSALTERQRVSLSAMEKIADVMGVQIHVFESKVGANGKRIGANGWYDPRDNSIHIDLHAGSSGEGTMLFTLAHELTHHIRKWSPAKFKILADFLMEEYGKKGVNVDALVREQMAKAKRGGRTISYDTAYEEVVADSMETMLSDGKVMEKLAKLKQKDASLWQKIKDFISELAAKIRKVYEGLKADSVEGQYVAEMKDSIEKLQELFAEALVDASENFQSAEKNTTQEGGVKYHARENGSLDDSEIRAIQGIGRKSINSFTAKDIKKTEGLARRYWAEMKEKSPFFRAWFGDWRVNDQTPVQVANQQGDTRGVQHNDDTGWDIQVSGKVFAESRHFASRNTSAIPYLSFVNDIVRKAVLLDSFGVGAGKAKSPNSILMHSLYAVADMGSGPELLKLYIEEINDPNRMDTTKRAYQLQNIEKAFVTTGGVQGQAPSSLAIATNAIHTVADLFAAVKQHDSQFSPNPPSKIVNSDGTPKVMYHGSPAQFTIFDRKKAKSSGLYGKGFYFTDSASHAGMYGNQYAVYLNIRSPLKHGRSSVSKAQVRKFLEAVSGNEDYSIENYGTYDVDDILRTIMGSRKKIDAFQVLQDINATAIGDLVEATELFNSVNGTDFDGIVVATETVAFYPTQIKSATDNIGTFDGSNPDIRYSIREAFYKEYDAWNKKDTHVSFVTGTTSNALKSIGMKDQNIVLRSGTVLQKLKDHPEMTFDIFKGIPELLEYPVIVQFSDAIDPKTKRPKYDSSITVLGELYADVKEGANTVQKPVLVSLELLPTKKKGTTVLDFAIIKSAYSKNALQQYLNENSILYIDPDKKRTDSWLSRTRLQLPFGENRYGPIRKIAYVDGKVKVQSPKNMSEMQKKLFEAGVIDEFGNKLLSDRDTKPASNQSGRGSTADGVKFSMRSPVEESRDLIAVHNLREDNLLAALEMGGMPMPSIAVTKKDGAYTDYGAISIVFRKSSIDPQADARNRVYGADAWTPTISQVDRGMLPENPSAQDFVEAMKQIGDRGVRMGDKSAFNLIAVAPAEYGSISEIKADSERLGDVDEEAVMEQVMEPIMTAEGILEELSDGNRKLREEAYSALMEAAKKGGSKDTIRKVFKDHGLSLTHRQTNDIQKAYHEIAKVRTTYFEAKPERVIRPDEWALVAVPTDVDPALKKKLGDLGVNIAEYERGNNESRIKAVNSNPELLFSDRDTESVSNRSLLANALEGAAQNEIEQKKLQEYKSKIERINAEEQKLRELNRQIKDLSFAKGPRDSRKINALRIEAQQTANRIDICDTQLLRLEASKPLQNILDREKKKAYQRAEQKGKKALDDYRLKAEAKQSEIMRDYREARAALRQAESETAVMEKEFIRLAKAYEKQAEKSAAKSGKDAQAISDLKAALKEEAKSHRQDQKMWESEFNRLLREYEAADRNIGKLEEKIERQKKAAAEKVEMRKRSVMREKIKAFKARLEKSLLNPTDRQYVPMGLINAMVEVCDLIDTDTDLYKSDGSINKAQEQRNLTKEKLQNLKDEYEKLRNHADPIYKGEFDEMVYAYLTELRDSFAGKNLKEMNLDELREMYEILRSIEETLQDARKLIGWGEAETVYEAGDTIVAEQNRITKSRKGGKRNAVQIARDNSLNLSLSPVRNVERMSGYNQESSLLKLFKKFEQGIRKKNRFVMEAYKSFESLTSGKEYEDAIYREVGGRKYVDVNGRKFGVSKMQMMQAILSHEREAANGMHHIEGSGFSFADLDMLRKGKLRDAISEEYSHRVPAAVELAAEFAEVLKNDRWCQDYMNAARKFFNGAAKDAINETGIALKHRIIAKDKSYIPFEVDKNFVVREISAENDIQQTINSYGMLKDVQKGASQPLIITGLNNILDRHIDQVGNVYGLAIEVRNFNKVWNAKSLGTVGNDPTVKAAIQRNWGIEGVKHIEQAVQDIQGKRIRERSALYDKVKSGYIGATFLLNLSVVTKQIGSLFSATSMLKWRGPVRQIGNLLYTMANHKKISAEVDRYTATAWMRRQGLSDAELHTFMTEGKKTLVGRAVDKLPAVFNPGKWITAMDHAVALSLWKYAKADTAKRTGLNGDELLKATAEFYDEVIENTQSMTDVLHRPEIQKRSDIISESFAMFKTDLYQMAGQLQVAAGRFEANKTKENGKALGRTVYAIAMSAVWAQLMTTVFALLRYKVNHYRDDEDKDLTYESWLKKQSFALAGDLMGYLFPIFGSEAVGVFENIMYGESEDIVDSIALTAINDLLDTMVTAASALKDGEMPKPDQMKKLTIKALQVFGVPANNIIRTYEAIHLHAKDIANGEFLSFEAGVDRSPKQHMHRIVEAMEEGRTDVAKGLFEEAIEETAIDKTGGSPYSEDDLKSARDSLRTALGNKFKEGDVSEKQAVEILVRLFDYKRDDAKSLVGEWAFKVEYGVAWSDRSDAYLDGTISARELKTALMNVGGKTAEEADEYIVELNFEKKFGFPYKDLKEQFMNGSISASEAKTNIIVVEGKSGEDAEERIAKWQFEADYPELIDRVTYAQYKRWETDGQPYGVSIELFADVAEFRDDGTSSSVKSQDEVKQYIMSAADDNQTRHALWCCFYKASTSPFD